jgi:hypothetical protein
MWTYNGVPFTEDMIGESYGFVYLIHNSLTGKSYYGKKFFTKAKTLRRKTRNKKLRVASDWQEYWGSNDFLLRDIEQFGIEHCTRTILKLCRSRGECAYWESFYIFQSHALLSEKYYNHWVSCKIHRKHLRLTTPSECDTITPSP